MVDIVPCSAPLKTKITAFTLTVGQASGLPTGQAGGLSYAESKNWVLRHFMVEAGCTLRTALSSGLSRGCYCITLLAILLEACPSYSFGVQFDLIDLSPNLGFVGMKLDGQFYKASCLESIKGTALQFQAAPSSTFSDRSFGGFEFFKFHPN